MRWMFGVNREAGAVMTLPKSVIALFMQCSGDEDQRNQWAEMARTLARNEGRDRVTVRHAKAAVMLAGPEFVERRDDDGEILQS